MMETEHKIPFMSVRQESGTAKPRIITRLIRILFVLAILLPCTANAFQLFPDVKQFIERVESCNKWAILAGALTSAAVHEASHVIALELKDIDYDFHGLRISGSGPRDYMSDLAGFMGQVGIGYLLPDSDFGIGWKVGTLLSLAIYPFHAGWRDGDFAGERRMEYSLFTLAAGVNVLIIEW
jgi:hypothetical protein